MFKSIQWTLQLWHAGLLAVVLTGFGTASYYGISKTSYDAFDATLASYAQNITTQLNPGPPMDRGRGGGGGQAVEVGGGGGVEGAAGPPPLRPPRPGSIRSGGPRPNNMDGNNPGDDQNGGPNGFNGDLSSPPGSNFGNGFGGPGGGATGAVVGGPGGFGPNGFGPGNFGGGPGGGGWRSGGYGGPGSPGGRGPRGPDFDRHAAHDGQFGDGQNDTDYNVIFGMSGEILRSTTTSAGPLGGPTIPPSPAVQPPTDPRDAAHNAAVNPYIPPPAPQVGPPGSPIRPTCRQRRGDIHEAYMLGPFGLGVVVGRSTLALQSQLHRTGLMLAATGAGVLLVGLLGGWLLSRRAVRPIITITHVAQNISASNLSRRIDITDFQSEFGTLAAVLNDTFARLEAAFQQQVRFTADASHELRTPLAVIHTHAQLALSRDRTAGEYKKSIATCLRASSSRMKSLVDSLAPPRQGRCRPPHPQSPAFETFQDIVEECIAMVVPLSTEKNIAIQADLQPVEITADAIRISQVIINLLTNAIRYNRTGGSVQVALKTDGKYAQLTVTDTGVGIPPEHQPHVFERFYRVDKARSREAGGSGLGLAIYRQHHRRPRRHHHPQSSRQSHRPNKRPGNAEQTEARAKGTRCPDLARNTTPWPSPRWEIVRKSGMPNFPSWNNCPPPRRDRHATAAPAPYRCKKSPARRWCCLWIPCAIRRATG